MSRYETCNSDCTEDKHSSACRVRRHRQTHVTPDDVTRPVTCNAEPCNAADVTPSCNAEDTINWADPDKDYSAIARKTQGAILVPGDPGYKGIVKCIDGVWCVPTSGAAL